MEDEILQALRRPPDFSERFNGYMHSLRDSIASSLGIPVGLDTDMNYSSANKLSIFFDGNGHVCDGNGKNYTFEAAFYISSKGPFFASRCFHKTQDNVKYIIAQSDGPVMLPDVIQKAAGELEELGLREISDNLLSKVAEGHVTLMDGVPATVFEVLFSELL